MSDLPQPVIEETDAVAERILSEWPWLEGTDDKIRVELRSLQNEWLELRDRLTQMKDDDIEEGKFLELKENLLVLEKKMRRQTVELLEKLQTEKK